MYFRTRVLRVPEILDFTTDHFIQSDKFQANRKPHLLKDVLQTLAGTGQAKDDFEFLKHLIELLFLHGSRFFLGFVGNVKDVKSIVLEEKRTCCTAGQSWKSFHHQLRARASDVSDGGLKDPLVVSHACISCFYELMHRRHVFVNLAYHACISFFCELMHGMHV